VHDWQKPIHICGKFSELWEIGVHFFGKPLRVSAKYIVTEIFCSKLCCFIVQEQGMSKRFALEHVDGAVNDVVFASTDY
jgi:hypothetical protein